MQLEYYFWLSILLSVLFIIVHHLVFLVFIFSVSAFRTLALYNLNVTVLSYPMMHNIHKNAPLSAGSQA
jgi:DNA polymerase sigma